MTLKPGHYIAKGRLLWTGETCRRELVMSEHEHLARRFRLRRIAEDALTLHRHFDPLLELRTVLKAESKRA